jgi:hypothetical protein
MGETLRSSNVETAYSCALHTSFSVRRGGATEKDRVTGETPELHEKLGRSRLES